MYPTMYLVKKSLFSNKLDDDGQQNCPNIYNIFKIPSAEDNSHAFVSFST